MIELFQMGGILFMSILTIEFAAVIFFTVKYFIDKSSDASLIRSTGLLAAITGILGQLIGLFSAFETIQKVGSVSPDILAAGLKVSMITTLYGLLIYFIALLISIIIKYKF